MIHATQVKAARALLKWSQEKLGEEAGLSTPTIQRMEHLGLGRSFAGNVEKVVKALEKAGVEFIDQDGSMGVILRR